jgi:hypothetical protein
MIARGARDLPPTGRAPGYANQACSPAIVAGSSLRGGPSLLRRTVVRVSSFVAMATDLTLVACAGRDPQPIATVQPQDQSADCAMISAEIQADNVKIKELADKQG